jgi:thiol-disulfide isomerase/thioredoxin
MFKLFKNTIFSAVLFVFLFSLINIASAQEKQKLYFFYGDGCPHCAEEEIFLDKLEKDYGDKLEILRYEVWYNKDNSDLLAEMTEKINYNVTGVPVTIVGEEAITGFADEETTGKEILRMLGFNDAEKQILPEKITVPLFGEVETKNLSLPAFAILVGFVDGFNPCAMWVLIFLIGLLLSLNDKRKVAIIGGGFLITSAFFYFLILNAWLNLLIFLAYIKYLKLIIGIVGIGAGLFQLKEYRENVEGVCKVTRSEGRKKIFERIKNIVKKENLWIALGGVVLLAISVNLVELVCSLGLPVIFTQVLALSNLSVWQHYLYILIYIFFFMIDDMVVFILALLTMQTKFFSTKYSRYSSLIGGIIMILVGLYLIIKSFGWIG